MASVVEGRVYRLMGHLASPPAPLAAAKKMLGPILTSSSITPTPRHVDRSERSSRAKNVSINFSDKLATFSDLWTPKVVAELNDYQFKLVKVKGEFVWHNHPETDEVFIVLEGSLRIDIEQGQGGKRKSVRLAKGEMCVVKKGDEHKPFAEDECHILLVEPRGVVNTGDAGGALTAQMDDWL